MQTDWSSFFGSFHPLIIHIPIGIILFAALLNIVTTNNRRRIFESAINLALLVGSLSAGFAALSGYFLAANGGYDARTLFWHKWIGIAVAVVCFGAWWVRRNKKADIFFLRTSLSAWLLSLSVLLIFVGGHLGGSMTHGEGYLTANMPAFLRSLFSETPRAQRQKLPSQLDSVQIFSNIIQPILTSKCVSCHNPDKQKGDLNLTTVAGILKAGKSGNTIVPGDIDKSELIHRITLDPGSSKFMPSNNQPPLTTVEIGLLKWWVAAGADFTQNIAESKLDEKTKYLLGFYLGFDEESNIEIVLPKVAPADTNIIRQLKEMKVVVRTLTAHSNLLDISFIMVQNNNPEHKKAILQKLLAIKEQVYHLNASNCGLTKDDLTMIAGFTGLVKLELQRNNLTDEALVPLKNLQQVAYLNLGQNPITDKSIPVVKQMAGLQKINLWQTQLTEESLKALQSAAQGLVVER